MRRITVEEARRAFDTLEWKPARRLWCGDESCCPLYAIAQAASDKPVVGSFEAIAKRLGLTTDYVISFTEAIDGERVNLERAKTDLAYSDGLAVRYALFGDNLI